MILSTGNTFLPADSTADLGATSLETRHLSAPHSTALLHPGGSHCNQSTFMTSNELLTSALEPTLATMPTSYSLHEGNPDALRLPSHPFHHHAHFAHHQANGLPSNEMSDFQDVSTSKGFSPCQLSFSPKFRYLPVHFHLSSLFACSTGPYREFAMQIGPRVNFKVPDSLSNGN